MVLLFCRDKEVVVQHTYTSDLGHLSKTIYIRLPVPLYTSSNDGSMDVSLSSSRWPSSVALRTEWRPGYIKEWQIESNSKQPNKTKYINFRKTKSTHVKFIHFFNLTRSLFIMSSLRSFNLSGPSIFHLVIKLLPPTYVTLPFDIFHMFFFTKSPSTSFYILNSIPKTWKTSVPVNYPKLTPYIFVICKWPMNNTRPVLWI